MVLLMLSIFARPVFGFRFTLREDADTIGASERRTTAIAVSGTIVFT